MERMSANISPDIGGLVIDIIDDLPIVYPKLYSIPQDVVEGMRRHDVIEMVNYPTRDEKIESWANLMRMGMKK
jgi:hypothetical protein